MLLKKVLQETVDSLDNEIKVDSLIEKLIILDKIDNAERQYEKGEVHTQDEVEKEVEKW
jgi:predicted transcriptional regulator